MKTLLLFCARSVPNLLMAVTAVVLFALLAVTIMVSILLEDWSEARAQERDLWENQPEDLMTAQTHRSVAS